jgi:hypothetical protein
MINTISNRTAAIYFAIISAVIMAVAMIIVSTADFAAHPDLLSLAVTIDITFGIPLLYYFIIAAKQKGLSITTLIVFLACTGIATIILPAANQIYLDQVKNLLIITELSIVVYGIVKIRSILRTYKKHSTQHADFVYNLTLSLDEIFGSAKATPLLIGEISMFRYGLLFWTGAKEILPAQKNYSTWKNSGYVTLWSVLCFVMLTETIGVHLLLWNWQPAVALVTGILSLYTIIFLVADLASIIKRPVVINIDRLFFRIGIRWNAIIALSHISSAEVIRNFRKEKETLDCSLSGTPNIRITLSKPYTIRGYYGIKKTATTLVFNIDNAEEFIAELNKTKAD